MYFLNPRSGTDSCRASCFVNVQDKLLPTPSWHPQSMQACMAVSLKTFKLLLPGQVWTSVYQTAQLQRGGSLELLRENKHESWKLWQRRKQAFILPFLLNTWRPSFIFLLYFSLCFTIINTTLCALCSTFSWHTVFYQHLASSSLFCLPSLTLKFDFKGWKCWNMRKQVMKAYILICSDFSLITKYKTIKYFKDILETKNYIWYTQTYI